MVNGNSLLRHIVGQRVIRIVKASFHRTYLVFFLYLSAINNVEISSMRNDKTLIVRHVYMTFDARKFIVAYQLKADSHYTCAHLCVYSPFCFEIFFLTNLWTFILIFVFVLCIYYKLVQSNLSELTAKSYFDLVEVLICNTLVSKLLGG